MIDLETYKKDLVYKNTGYEQVRFKIQVDDIELDVDLNELEEIVNLGSEAIKDYMSS